MQKLILPFLLLCAACTSGEVRDNLGMNRAAPDEFKVVSRPPLSVPPEFYMRPPEPGAPPRITGSTEEQAESLLLRRGESSRPRSLEEMVRGPADTAVGVVMSKPLASTGESTLLSKAGAGAADPDIRSKLYTDKTDEPETGFTDGEYGLDFLLGKGGEPVVDASEEAKRIRRNKDENKPINEGEVEVLDPQDRSTVERIFDF